MPRNYADICIELQKDWLYGLCLRLERNRHDADDLFQETWLRALARFDTFDTDRVIRPWLTRVCVNAYRDRLRRFRRHSRHVAKGAGPGDRRECLESVSSAAPAPDEQAADREFRQALAACVDGLDDKYRLPLLLQYANGIPYDGIAGMLGLNPGTLKSRLNEAKKRLRRQLEAMGYDGRA